MYATTKGYLQANPQVIERFVRAYNKGVDWINDNKGSEEWLKIISAYTRMEPEQLKGLNLPLFEKTVDPAGIDQVVELMRKHKMLEGAFDSKALLYTTATQPPR
jgi:ABC-type nitrate/sulfonate/bicarbonate transport system substrate-binding protein